MSPEPTNTTPPHDGEGGKDPTQTWQQAAATLAFSRFALIQAESKAAVSGAAKKIILLAIAALLLLFTWIILVAATVAAIAANTTLSWYHAAFAAAAIHLILALIILFRAKTPEPPTFQHTRAEFQKDREWLNQITSNPK